MGVSGGLRTEAQVRVTYRRGIVLKLPITATSLRPDLRPLPAAAKLSVEGLRELAALAGGSKGLCPSSLPRSGTACPPSFVPTSPTISPRRCRG